jgi:hypothetical protein
MLESTGYEEDFSSLQALIRRLQITNEGKIEYEKLIGMLKTKEIGIFFRSLIIFKDIGLRCSIIIVLT